MIIRAITSNPDLIPPERTRLSVIAAGKASVEMAAAFGEAARDRPTTSLIADTGHPTPDEGSVAAGRRALAIAAETGTDGHLVVLLSGGASAMLAAPVDGVTLDDKRAATEVLLKAGADIQSLNTVRKHLSKIKGGQLAGTCPGHVVTLAISDVVGDDPSSIGSGPTVADASTFGDALAIVDRLQVRDRMPPSVIAHLQLGTRGDRVETPKPGDARLARSTFHLVGRARDAVEGARAAAESLGYAVRQRRRAITGEAREAAASYLTDIARDTERKGGGHVCALSFGETTVSVTGTGRGGRNQEFALAAAPQLASIGPRVAMASVGTDGIDGPTDAAGAIVDPSTFDRARAAGISAPDGYLDENDTYAFFDRIGDLIRTGPTSTNVGDLQVLLVGR